MTDDIQEQELQTTEVEDGGSPNPVLVVFLILPLLGIIVALLMVANDLREQRNATAGGIFSAANPTALINSRAPDFTLPDLNGQEVSLTDYRGKILFLNFWQTTCAPCIEEMPDFLDFMFDQPDDVTWLTINFDENNQRVREFFATYNFLGIPTVMDYDSNVRYGYGVFGAPVTFVIDPEGVIQYMNIGQLSYEDMETLVDSVREGT